MAVSNGKRGREEAEEELTATKQQKVAAVETMDTEAPTPLWEDSESDF